jgi:hypothetical protein
MLGRFSRGMKVSIPAVFRDGARKPVDVDNAVCSVEHFSSAENKVVQILSETAMNRAGDGFYLYEYIIPPNVEHGNYIVRIKAKQPGSKSNLLEATDYFEVAESLSLRPKNEEDILAKQQEALRSQSNQTVLNPTVSQPMASNAYMQRSGERLLAEDVVTNEIGQPLAGVHVNIFEKNSFIPKSPNNIKIASAITTTEGKWSVNLLPGDYVFTYKHPDRREFHEFRKVQKL